MLRGNTSAVSSTPLSNFNDPLEEAIRLGWNNAKQNFWNSRYDKWPELYQLSYEHGRQAYAHVFAMFGTAPFWTARTQKMLIGMINETACQAEQDRLQKISAKRRTK